MRVDRRARQQLPAPPVSVLTLVRNRQGHLDALVAGLTRQMKSKPRGAKQKQTGQTGAKLRFKF